MFPFVLPNLQFGSINKREFATRIVAQRQEITHKSGTCILHFFSGGNYKFPILFSAKLQIRLNGGTCSLRIFSAVGILASLR